MLLSSVKSGLNGDSDLQEDKFDQLYLGHDLYSRIRPNSEHMKKISVCLQWIGVKCKFLDKGRGIDCNSYFIPRFNRHPQSV